MKSNKNIYYLIFVFIVSSSCLSAQGLKGIVLNFETKQAVPFAIIQLIDLNSGLTANENGEFIIKKDLPKSIKIKISAIGYESITNQITPNNDSVFQFYLKEKHVELAEVTVSSATGLLQKHTITNVESRSLTELNTVLSTNLGEALSNIKGVYQVSTGVGISKPVIRGLSGVRVVTYLNGLRIENQQWGGDHGMGVTENGIGNIEVIKGPSSLLYGADALGGVVYFSDENYAKIDSKELNFETQFESNSMRTKNYATYKIAKNNLRFNIFANYSNSADYKLANQLFVKNSRFNELNLKGALGYNRKNWVMNVRYNFINNYIGLPGHTHDTIISAATFMVTKQSRKYTIPIQHIQNNYLLFDNSFYFNKSDLKIQLGTTSNHLLEFEEKITIPDIDKKLVNATYNTRYKYYLKESTHIVVGAQGMLQWNTNGLDATEILIPNSRMIDNGAFALFQTELKGWEFLAGARYDNRYIETLANFKGTNTFSKTFNGFNYSAGASKIVNNYSFRANVSSGFRPPHFSELISNGVHHGAIRYEVGNINLKNERATQIDLSAEYNNEHLSLVLSPFYNQIQNYIYIEPQNIMIDNFPVFEYKQVKKANLMGVDAGIHYHPHFLHQLHIEPSASYIYAENENNEALPLIPQTRINTQLRFEFESKKKIKLENIAVQHLYFLQQNRIANYETVSPEYQIINIGANFKIEKNNPVFIKVGVKNLLNANYIDHLSRLKNIGLAAPGRNFYVSFKININKP
ncbi:MAG: TonB-dependent receptor [Bacteroidota bacterium]